MHLPFLSSGIEERNDFSISGVKRFSLVVFVAIAS
jgi:hypothetical protein